MHANQRHPQCNWKQLLSSTTDWTTEGCRNRRIDQGLDPLLSSSPSASNEALIPIRYSGPNVFFRNSELRLRSRLLAFNLGFLSCKSASPNIQVGLAAYSLRRPQPQDHGILQSLLSFTADASTHSLKRARVWH